MKKLRTSQNGLGLIELLLLLLLILILILLGWYVWSQKNKSKQPPASNSASSSEPAKKAETPAKEVPAATYLNITEWGVKVKLSDDIKDAYYDSTVSSNLSTFSLRVHSLDSEPDCKTGAQSVAAIFKVGKDEKDPQDETKKYSDTQKGVVIGDSFYFTGVAQYYCSEVVAKQAVLDKVRTAFTAASTQIEKL